MLNRLLFTTFLLFLFNNLDAQQSLRFSQQLKWSEIQLNESGISTAKVCDACDVNPVYPFLPTFSKKFEIQQSGKISAKVINASFVDVNDERFYQLKTDLTPEIVVDAEIGFLNKNPFGWIQFVPMIKDESGKIKELVSFDLEIKIEPNSQAIANKTTSSVDNSILNQGTFYKFKVSKEGIHKIDFAFLESMDITPTDISFSNFRVYGNGGGMLPELAGAERVDDLLENAVQIVDNNGNGKFDQEDYVLFFAECPHQWYNEEGSNNFTHEQNIYSDFNHYFINFDIGQGKRISTYNASPTANEETSSFDALILHEEEKVNILGSGRVWYGNQMASGGNTSVEFDFPKIIKEEPVRISVAVGAQSFTATSYMNFSVDGSDLKTFTLSKVGNALESPGGTLDSEIFSILPTGDKVKTITSFSNSSTDGKGWIDYITAHARRKLDFSNANLESGQLVFRDARSVGDGKVTKFNLENASGVQIWDVTDLDAVKKVSVNNGSFSIETSQLRKFIAFNNQNHFQPEAVGAIEKQNLHEVVFPEMIIVTHPDFIDQSNDLADFHREQDGLDVKVVNVFEIYNEFASGNQDLSAIRDYVKMYYDRAESFDQQPKYLLLMGDASYDFKNITVAEANNSNKIPMYQSYYSVNKTKSYCSDDYLAMLDDNEGLKKGDGINSATFKLDIAVGRFPVQDAGEAANIIEKIKHYKSEASKGEWWNTLTFIGDDGNSNLHVNQAEQHADNLAIYPQYNIDKYYLDAFPQVPGPNGDSYPDANKALLDRIFSGSLIMNYIGHGSENTMSKEGVLTKEIIKSLDNKDKLSVFVTATCTFSRLDNPFNTSAGEWLLLNPDGGAVTIVSTVRVVGANGNFKINKAFLDHAFEKYNGSMPTIGESTMLAKNALESGATNFRKFVVLGDPALKMNFPQHKVITTSIKNETLDEVADTVKALSRLTIAGEVVDNDGNKLNDFNGTVTPVIFDKALLLSTLGNDLPSAYDPDTTHCPGDSNDRDEVSCPREFDLQQNIIFKGNASVENGAFEFTFVVPKDISYNFGRGKLSYFAESGAQTAVGYDTTIVIGGISDQVELDDEGPDVEVFLNDDNFVFGGLVQENAILLVKLQDENGINTVGTGIGHDLTAKLDEEKDDLDENDLKETNFILNNYYNSELDDFTKGTIEYPLSDLEPGLHTIRVKAWDVFNNSGEGYTEFLVSESADLALQNVLNYPNPFTDKTNFWFEHNRPGDMLNVRIQIFTLSGRVVKTIQKDVAGAKSRIDDLEWNGLDEFGNKIGKGVYIYQVSVTDSNNETVDEIQRLVLLK